MIWSTSQLAAQENNVNWWKTPAEGPDLKNLWHEKKEYVSEALTKDQLISGIHQF